jgi:hypothetical protein
MPARGKQQRISGRLHFAAMEESVERPELAVHAIDADGNVLDSAAVGADGSFSLDSAVAAKAHRVVVAAADADLTDPSARVEFRPEAFANMVKAGDLILGPADWGRFLWRFQCVSATIRRCFPFWFIFDDLVRLPRLDLGIQSPHIFWPPFRCAPICEGTFEVYRRTCCCPPWPPIPWPPEPWPPKIPIPDPIPDPFPIPFPEPDPPPFPRPGPGPDPAPFALLERVLTGGAIDTRKLNAPTDRLALTTLRGEALQQFIRFRPYLWCRCGAGTKVAEGFVGQGGAINACWREPFRFLLPGCHDEYAFVVKQNIAGVTVTIYDGPAAGQWFESGEEMALTSYHPRAIGCRESDPPPGDGAFVVLQDIGSTESHHLRTPMSDGADSTDTPSATLDGLLDVGGTNYALGGDLYLRYHFSESMRGVGGRYYRVQVAPANLIGDPAGPWETLAVPTWKTWQSVGGNILPGAIALGPQVIGGEPDLFDIPYDTGVPLGAGEEWQDGQYHAVFSSAAKLQGRYLVRIEVFDAAGNRLDPAVAGFTFRRWDTPTTTVEVPFQAMTHLFWVDNRTVTADIVDITGPGPAGGDCKFFVGGTGANVHILHKAFHPQPGTPSFMLSYSLVVNRGISGTVVDSFSSAVEVGETGPPGDRTISIGTLLGGEEKCSFSVRLYVYAKVHNGSGRLSNLDGSDVSAFAAQQVPFP